MKVGISQILRLLDVVCPLCLNYAIARFEPGTLGVAPIIASIERKRTNQLGPGDLETCVYRPILQDDVLKT